MRYLFGVFSGAALVLLGGYCFVRFGGMPASTQAPALPLEKFLASAALRAAMKDSIDLKAPFEPSEEHLKAGAEIYLNHCAGCHGLEGEQVTAFQRGMYPHPPSFFAPGENREHGHEREHHHHRHPIGETFWKVKNGIRLTGMPGFSEILTDTQIWEVSLLLSNHDRLSKHVQERLLPRNPARK